MDFLQYYGRVFRTAFMHSFDIAQAVIFSLVIVVGAAAWLFPKLNVILTDWATALTGWQIAAVTLGGIVLARLVLAFYWTFDKKKRRADSAEQKIKGYLKFVRAIRTEGGGGHYLSYVTARNISVSEKMHNCRCEVAELLNSAGDVI
jgi:hypothetical protein